MLMDFLRTYTKKIEQVSVDECYMDFTELVGRYPTPVDGAMEIKEEVKKRFGFTVNIGISSNKLLAKMASDFQKPDRIHTENSLWQGVQVWRSSRNLKSIQLEILLMRM